MQPDRRERRDAVVGIAVDLVGAVGLQHAAVADAHAIDVAGNRRPAEPNRGLRAIGDDAEAPALWDEALWSIIMTTAAPLAVPVPTMPLIRLPADTLSMVN